MIQVTSCIQALEDSVCKLALMDIGQTLRPMHVILAGSTQWLTQIHTPVKHVLVVVTATNAVLVLQALSCTQTQAASAYPLVLVAFGKIPIQELANLAGAALAHLILALRVMDLVTRIVSPVMMARFYIKDNASIPVLTAIGATHQSENASLAGAVPQALSPARLVTQNMIQTA